MEQVISTETPMKPTRGKKRILLAIVFFVIGVLILLVGLTFLISNQGTDSEGYTLSNVYHVRTDAYAFTAYMNEFKATTWEWLGMNNIAQIKYLAKNLDAEKELFIGYATTAQSNSYRQSFRCEIPTYWTWHARPYEAEINITTTMMDGTGAPASLPQTQTFWVASAQSADTAVMTYVPQHEQHVWFIMNSDGSNNITADIQIGFKSPILALLPLMFIPLGILLLICGFVVLRRKKNKIKPAS